MTQAHTAAYPTLPFDEPQLPRRVPRWAWVLAVLALVAGMTLAVAAVEYDEVVREWLSLAGASEAGTDQQTPAAEPPEEITADPTEAGSEPTDLASDAEHELAPTDQGGADSSNGTDAAGPGAPSASPESASSPTTPTTVSVPNLNGTGRTEAEQTLWDLDLTPVVVFASDGGSSGLVIGCDVCGTSVQSFSTVVLTISAEPAPDVYGQTEANASNVITGAGLTSYVEYGPSPTVPVGSVYDQSPLGSVPEDGIVTIWVSTGP